MNDPRMIQLQQEAAQRVQRMAERSRRLVREHPVHVYRPSAVQPRPTPPPQPEPPCQAVEPPCEAPLLCEQPTAEKKTSPCKAGTLLSGVEDHEQLLLLLLAVMLFKNGAPTELLLALLYVAL